MADIHAVCARFTQAKELYVRAMQINSLHLGPEHPEVSENLNAIGKRRNNKRYREKKEDNRKERIGKKWKENKIIRKQREKRK